MNSRNVTRNIWIDQVSLNMCGCNKDLWQGTNILTWSHFYLHIDTLLMCFVFSTINLTRVSCRWWLQRFPSALLEPSAWGDRSQCHLSRFVWGIAVCVPIAVDLWQSGLNLCMYNRIKYNHLQLASARWLEKISRSWRELTFIFVNLRLWAIVKIEMSTLQNSSSSIYNPSIITFDAWSCKMPRSWC